VESVRHVARVPFIEGGFTPGEVTAAASRGIAKLSRRMWAARPICERYWPSAFFRTSHEIFLCPASSWSLAACSRGRICPCSKTFIPAVLT
jgi:hypothetical protein